MNALKLCPSKHVQAADLDDKDHVVTLKGFDFGNVGTEQERKGIMLLEEFDRGWVCNKTNILKLIGFFGKDTDNWKGKKITIYPSKTDFKGKEVDCIRIRDKLPA